MDILEAEGLVCLWPCCLILFKPLENRIGQTVILFLIVFLGLVIGCMRVGNEISMLSAGKKSSK